MVREAQQLADGSDATGKRVPPEALEHSSSVSPSTRRFGIVVE